MADQSQPKGKAKAPSDVGASDAAATGSSSPSQHAANTSSTAAPAAERNDAGRPEGGSAGGSLASSVIASMRSSMAGNQIGSLLASASGGKGDFASFRQNGQAAGQPLSKDELRSAMMADLAGGSAAAGGSATGATFRSSPASQAPSGASHRYDAFALPPTIPRGDAAGGAPVAPSPHQDVGMYSPDRIGPYTSSSELDRALHAQVRAMEALNVGARMTLDGAWQDAEQSARNLTDDQRDLALDPEWNQRWASGVGGVDFPPLQARAQRQQTDAQAGSQMTSSSDFMDLLAADEAQESLEGASAAEFARPAWDRTSDATLASLPTQWRPPSPSLPAHLCVTREQFEMHRAISAAQTDAEHALRQGEGIAPRADDREAREGVYAPTAEEALRSIWEGRGGAVEKSVPNPDVYGLPPTLAETMRKAVADASPEEAPAGNEEARKKAIQRLEALWGHLSNTRPSSTAQAGAVETAAPAPKSAGGADWMEAWLKAQGS
ncbi:uncharacterized protein PSFLO_02718 [Pseudozyma flocculosa]|uniref:Uncharacterized protein n=1 Tax=Pseudozyma flocculosa TaxID=84751 RepID=A0A5C3F038_9BASI|nr:uncharacterized protein PSFLO_02718 [Pseudozyma flocculosa]